MTKKQLNKKPRTHLNNLSAYSQCWCACSCSNGQWGGNNYTSIHQPNHSPNFQTGGPVPWSSEETK